MIPLSPLFWLFLPVFPSSSSSSSQCSPLTSRRTPYPQPCGCLCFHRVFCSAVCAGPSLRGAESFSFFQESTRWGGEERKPFFNRVACVWQCGRHQRSCPAKHRRGYEEATGEGGVCLSFLGRGEATAKKPLVRRG